MYYNGTAKQVVGGDVKETTLDGLIPGTSYSITVRAYQDILGPPSTPLHTITDDGKYSYNTLTGRVYCSNVYFSTIVTNRPVLHNCGSYLYRKYIILMPNLCILESAVALSM